MGDDAARKRVTVPDTLTFQRCARGFILRTGSSYTHDGTMPLVYAFDKVEALADWLVEQYETEAQA